MEQDTWKRMGRLVSIAAFKVVKAIVVKTAVFWVPLGLILLLTWLAYNIIFEFPKEALISADRQFVGASVEADNTFQWDSNPELSLFWSDNQDAGIIETYQTLKWNEGLTLEQQLQVEVYMLDWKWLAAVDRTLGDPDFTFARGSGRLRLEPEETFALVRPIFEWETFQKEMRKQVCVEEHIQVEDSEDEGSAAEIEIVYTIREHVSYEPQVLLMKAKTIHGEYEYAYQSKMTEATSDSLCGTLTTTTTYMVISHITALSDHWQPLRDILSQHGITTAVDQDMLMEYWLSFMDDVDGVEHEALSLDWMPTEGELKWPTTGRISSTFGMRIHPISQKRKLHAGVDVAAQNGTPVYAAADGTAIFTGYYGNAGNAIMLQHADLETRYYHLSQILITEGQAIRKGELIGKVGATGGTTGPHLHYEVRVNGTPVNPIDFYGGNQQ